MKTKETLKAKELIGIGITNTGSEPSKFITAILPADNKGHFRTDYNYVIQLDNKTEKHTVEGLQLTKILPKEVIFEKSPKELAHIECWNGLNNGFKIKYCIQHNILNINDLQKVQIQI